MTLKIERVDVRVEFMYFDSYLEGKELFNSLLNHKLHKRKSKATRVRVLLLLLFEAFIKQYIETICPSFLGFYTLRGIRYKSAKGPTNPYSNHWVLLDVVLRE